MDQKEMFKQMVDFNKKAFENTFNALVMFQDQTETMFKGLLEQATWMPNDGKAAILEWVKAYKKSRDDFKKAVEDGFRKMDELFPKAGSGE